MFNRYRKEIQSTPDALDEFAWQTIGEMLKELPLEKRLEGLSPEECLRNFSPEERLKDLSPEERLKGLSNEQCEEMLRILKKQYESPPE